MSHEDEERSETGGRVQQPRRRDLLAMLAATGATGLAGTAAGRDARGPAARHDGAQSRRQEDGGELRLRGTVEDLAGTQLTEGGRISRIEVTTTAVPAGTRGPRETESERTAEIAALLEGLDGDGSGPVGGYARAQDGTFDIVTPTPSDFGPDDYGYVFVYVRVVVDPPEGDTVEWFTADTVPPDASERTFTVDSRLLAGEDAPVAIWETVDPDDTDQPRSLYVESRGDIHRRRRGDDDDTEERGEITADTHLESGLVTLQAPEDVSVGYRTESTRATQPLEPDGRYTDRISDARGTIQFLGFVDHTAAVAPGPGSTPGLGANRPLYPAFHDGNTAYYEPYNDGREERQEENAKDLFFDVLNLFLFSIGLLSSGGILAGVLLGTAGLALGQLKSGAIQGPSDLPTWATESGTSYIDGRLPTEQQGYDFIAGQWRWRTYSFVQRYPVAFENDQPAAFCLRGAVQRNRTDTANGGKEALRVQQAFQLDPTVRSPRDETGVPVPEGPVDDEIPEPTPRVDVSNWSPTAGDTVSFDASDSEAFGSLSVEEYRWQFVPPTDQDDYYDIDGDGGADLIGPKGFEETRSVASGASVEESFDVAGTHEVFLTVIDEAGNAATRQVALRVEQPPPPEIFPSAVDTDDGDCFYPPTEERIPGVGENAARHLGYGCGEWKVYDVIPGENYTIAVTVDGCHDCLLYDAAYAVEEPSEPDASPEDSSAWAVEGRQEDPMGKARSDAVLERTYVPESDRIRVRNLDGNAGWGCYVSVYGPRPVDGSESGSGDEE